MPNYISNVDSLGVSSKSYSLISDFIERLQCKIPLDSRIKLMFSNEKKEFIGFLSIISGPLNFKIEFNEEQISGVLLHLSMQSNLHIKNWLQNRIAA